MDKYETIYDSQKKEFKRLIEEFDSITEKSTKFFPIFSLMIIGDSLLLESGTKLNIVIIFFTLYSIMFMALSLFYTILIYRSKDEVEGISIGEEDFISDDRINYKKLVSELFENKEQLQKKIEHTSTRLTKVVDMFAFALFFFILSFTLYIISFGF